MANGGVQEDFRDDAGQHKAQRADRPASIPTSLPDPEDIKRTYRVSASEYATTVPIKEADMTGRLMPCIGKDGEFASDKASRLAASKWLGELIEEGKRWSEARGEIAEYYRASGMENRVAHAKSRTARDFIKPWLHASNGAW